jgi:hypothetical protein
MFYLFLFDIRILARSQALPGNAFLVALPPVHYKRWQSHQESIPRQSLGTSSSSFSKVKTKKLEHRV